MLTNCHFSIICTSYNYADYIKETIESVISQTYPYWEMIIIDDGSSDNSFDIISNYMVKDRRIKLYTHQNHQNKGLKDTLKLGIEKASYDWIVFLESDDTITSNYLQKKLEIIEANKDVKFIFNDVNMFGLQERIDNYKDYFKETKEFLSKNQYPKKQLNFFKKRNLIPTFSTVALHKSLLKNIDYETPIKQFLDYYLWTQIASKTSFYYIDEKLTNWRMHKSYITTLSFSPMTRKKFNYKKFRVFHPILKFVLPVFFMYLLASSARMYLIEKLGLRKGQNAF